MLIWAVYKLYTMRVWQYQLSCYYNHSIHHRYCITTHSPHLINITQYSIMLLSYMIYESQQENNTKQPTPPATQNSASSKPSTKAIYIGLCRSTRKGNQFEETVRKQLVLQICANIQKDCAFYDRSMKLCTAVVEVIRKIFSYRATLNFTQDVNGAIFVRHNQNYYFLS